MSVVGVVRGAWRSRWSVVRLAAAGLLVWILAADTPARLARLQLAALPEHDFAGEVRTLRQRGRFAEALVVADAGLSGLGPGAVRDEIERERAEAEREQQSTLRRLRDLARGAMTGGGAAARGGDAPDPSLELLVGAVATDLFVVGDVRDLVVQGARWARGQETDKVTAALAGLGLATTLAPEIDWAPSIVKAARKAGAVTERFGDFITLAVRQRRVDDLGAVVKDTASIARHASPAGAVRLMRLVDSGEDAARLARFLERTGAPGAQALRVAGAGGRDLLRSADGLRAAGKADEAIAAERLLLTVGRKGEAGGAWLRRGWHRPLLRPHPVLGIAKSLWKGNAQALVARVIERMDPFGAWALPAAAAWLFFEAAMLLGRWFGPRPRASARPGPAPVAA